ncbi:hypothetical protein C8Q77DRAFT_1170434 [Trametes polyzona]|nr:hypothetical protein C8Q77DRAFT_1170434 [Trametes polyzona]
MPPNGKHIVAPKVGVPRPELPRQHANPHIRQIDASKPPAVKFQEIVRDGQSTIVGRIKIPTPTGHAFILRRLDTGAISMTTMFRAAFPTASDEAEKGETNWVKLSFDTSGANKSGKARFAGTWVTPDVALYLADSYDLGGIIPALAAAVPDPNTTFRRSRNAQQPTPTASPAAEPGPAPAKRRREASPASPAPASAATEPVKQPAVVPPSPPPSRVASSPAPRRSARLVASPPAQPVQVAPKTPRTRKAAREAIPTPAGSDETAVDEDVEAAKVAEPNMQEDIREQQELIAKLKADREAAKAQQQQQQQDQEEAEAAPTPSQYEAEKALTEDEPAGTKRPREEEPNELRFNFKEPAEPDVGERAIATNSRVRLLSQLPPERKSLAWGALAFAAGLGAISFLPNLQGVFF